MSIAIVGMYPHSDKSFVLRILISNSFPMRILRRFSAKSRVFRDHVGGGGYHKGRTGGGWNGLRKCSTLSAHKSQRSAVRLTCVASQSLLLFSRARSIRAQTGRRK